MSTEKRKQVIDREEKYLHKILRARNTGGVMAGDIEGAFHRLREGLEPPEPNSASWRIIEQVGFVRGDFGIATLDPKAIESGDEMIVYSGLTRRDAERIVQAHNACIVAATPDLVGVPRAGE